MLKNEREREILRIIEDRGGFCTVQELCALLFASESSIRRDLKALDARGLIRRSHGGAERMENPSGGIAFAARGRQNVEAKRMMAEIAKRLVKNGDIIFLDQSSSAFYLAEQLSENRTLTVVTNNVEILALLAASPLKVYSSGGWLCADNRTCLIGEDAAETFSRVRADLLFFSARSLSEDGVISDLSREEVLVREAMMKNAARKIFLCDSAKLGTKSAYKQCDLDAIDIRIDEHGAYDSKGNKIHI